MPPVRTRRRRSSGNEVVDHLNAMVNDLIKENRQLRRQLDKLSTRTTSATSQAVDRGLRGIQRRLAKALSDGTVSSSRRRPSATSTAGRRTARPRKPVSPEVAEKRRQALAKARAVRAAKREAAAAGG